MSGPPLRRRWVLAAALGAMSMWSSGLKSAPRSENARERVRKKLVSLLHEPEYARKLGRVYLRSQPGRPVRPLELAETVLAEMGPRASSEAIRRYLVARIQRELQDAEVLSLDGWIMSPTEARLCSLAASPGTL
jgi:hypothetical protein